MDRREFLKCIPGGIIMLSASPLLMAKPRGRKVRFGVITDLHYADIETKGSRYYRDSLAKMREAMEHFNNSDLDFIIELGDMKDMAPGRNAESTSEYLDAIENEFSKFRGPIYHVLGNHDMDCLSKEEFLAHAQSHGKAKGKAYYAFTVKGMRFIVLDANHNKDMSPYCRGNFKWTSAWIPEEQKEWLRSELKANAERPVVVFIHQLLDSFSDISRKVCVGNADEIRDILEQHGQVLAVFQGHHHPGHYSRKSGIHYVTLKGAIEGPWPDRNSFAIVEARPDGSMKLEGWKDCPDMQLYRQKDNI